MLIERDNGVVAIENLIKKKGKFDYILLETTGLADPAPIASMFWLDDELESNIYLDGLLTVIDAKYVLQQLSEKKQHGKINECAQQIAMADRIVINKRDLVTDAQLNEIQTIITSINSSAKTFVTSHGLVPIEFILDLHAFDGKDGSKFEISARSTVPSSSHLDSVLIMF
jgi:G3E family GTPase